MGVFSVVGTGMYPEKVCKDTTINWDTQPRSPIF